MSILLAAASQAMASGYRIPEQSLNSTARAGSYVAYTPGVDATYYNPANMSWLGEQVDAGGRMLPGFISVSIDYTGDARTDMFTSDYNGKLRIRGTFLLPDFFCRSLPDYKQFPLRLFRHSARRAVPNGGKILFPQSTAEEFTLKVL